MRFSGIVIALSVTIGPALVLPLLTNAAQAVQDQPVMIGGIETVCTGVGSAKDNPAWSAYPVKLVFANPAGENLAQVHLSVMQGGKPLVETECDAPWVLMKLPLGSYDVAATVPGNAGPRVGKASFATKGGAQQTVNVTIAGAP
ncbi:MAG: hypothetical protein V4559_03915 [Pseudomonadota bacterium]